ncbi:MAG: UDP-N-acetylglucosamine--N-acetylmuramyl-(pentapeptide) pyrophosphoryl-undecaprenol N-acetylglucosamine transferase [Candidatus Gracilibacteria bacterium]|nr:UDP-N-acetylglucosamine--N-acetylmuramyl-(pentapeptide) pyrophosphoryl-undecaprenol N-acetylglucosamine transferase [Candidatus Gracilibacteria bacterium]
MKVIALTGGGTGGHIYPLLSIYNYLKDDKNFKFIWVGEQGSLEDEEAYKNKIPFEDISAGKVRRYFDKRNLYEPLKNISGVIQGMQLIKKHNIDIIFSKGGYVSLPLCIAGKMLGKKIYIHESDTVTGLSNKFIGQLATKIFYTFPNKKIDGKKHILTGQILNPELIDYIDNIDVPENPFLNVLVIAGSQGSTRIFENLLKILPELFNIKFHVILGEKNLHFRDNFRVFPNVIAHDFVTQKRLGKIYKNIDIAITRGGATTLWELNKFGIHSIIIPLKESANNHQVENAKYFKENFGSDIIYEDENIDFEILKLLQKYKNLRKIGLNLNDFFEPLKKIKENII